MTAAGGPWWLEAGSESCPFCEVRYQFEIAYHCVECDRPVCPACVTEIHTTRRVYCPECDPTEAR